ncbi:MAG: M14 family zinc carboxypeptidase [Candidatus Aminicenantes bacterium]|nr:M14 family zinc carboxypeptidase [Candidatus Aminicenantes bacterium]MDH5385200.1 M14 family zinc carboxypeptidase [Candidatus Aminicenantes bacterium]
MRYMKTTRSFLWMVFILIWTPLIFGQALPKPEEILGFKVGADYHLASYAQAVEYFKILAKDSDRIKLFDAGKTSMGQTLTYAVISSAENIKNLDRYKQISKQLALTKGLSQEEAKTLVQEGKAIVYIDGGLHASECAPAQHNIQLAYDLLSASDSKTLRILNDVILILVFANPDGMNLLAEWYHPNVGTPYEVSSMPWLYHVYAGHDNNRDSYIANLVETQILSRLVNKEWYPVIMYNHHQTAPFPARIWVPPNSEPTNPNVHPLIVRWQNLIGSAMGAAFDAESMEGAISRIVFDTWYPGYVTQVVDSHNIISILTETALYRYATPHFYTIRDFPEEYRDLTMSAFYPNPWKGGWWRLKDAVDYCLTASKAVLDVASKYRHELLCNKYLMGTDVIRRFKKEPPFVWIIPMKQDDPGNTSLLLNRMILLGIDVYKSKESFSCDGLSYPVGTFIIPMSQPFALFVKNVFEEQKYPDLRKYPDLWQGLIRPKKFEGAPFESYDQMGWTLPYQFGVYVHAANTPINTEMTLVEDVKFQKGEVSGKTDYAYILRHEENNSFTAMNRILKSGGKVFWSREGAIIVPSNSVEVHSMQKLADELDLKITGLSKKPVSDLMSIKPVRLALYKSWIPSADEGWTRFILEKFEFPYTNIHDADIRAGNLNQNFDAIIIPDTYRPESLINGHDKGTMPPKYVGGMTSNGVRNLKAFAENGGTIIFLNSSCDFAVEYFDIPVKNVMKGIKREQFVCDGSILRMEFDTRHPVAFGMPKEAAAIFESSCAFSIMPSFDDKKEAKTVAKYPEENPLMSGWIYGDSLLRQKSSIVDVPYGNGKIILLGFPVQFRAQPYGTFKLLFNSIFYAGIKSSK